MIRQVFEMGYVPQVNNGFIQDLGSRFGPKDMLQFSASIESSSYTDVQRSYWTTTPVEVAHPSELASQTSGSACGGGSLTVTPEEKRGTLTLLAPDSGRAGGPGEPLCWFPDLGKKPTGVEPGASGLTRSQKRNRKRRRTLQSIACGNSGILKGGGRGIKRSLSSGSTSSPAPRVARKDPQPGSFASAVNLIQMAIVKDNYPAVKMSQGNLLTLERAILERMDAIPVNNLSLEVLGTSLWKGAIIVKCGNPITMNWIGNTFDGDREVMGGEALRVMKANELPKPYKVAFRTKDTVTQDPCILLRRLKRLNRGLNTEHWKTLDLLKEPCTYRWIFEVGPEDVQAIREINFRAYCGIDRGVFKVLSQSEKKTD